MLQRKIKKIIPIICSVIIGFSSFSVCAAEPEDTIFSSSDVTQIFSSDIFTSTSSVGSNVSSYINNPCYSFFVPDFEDDLIIDFNFDFSALGLSKYSSYSLEFPFIFSVSSRSVEYDDISIFLKIVYDDGSVSSYSSSSYDLVDLSKKINVYYAPFSIVLSGNKLLNIKDSYFVISRFGDMSGYTSYFGFRKDYYFTVSKSSLDYNPFFTSSLNWVSDIFKMVSDNFSLVVLCIGFPVVAFSFLLLKRLIRS